MSHEPSKPATRSTIKINTIPPSNNIDNMDTQTLTTTNDEHMLYDGQQTPKKTNYKLQPSDLQTNLLASLQILSPTEKLQRMQEQAQ